MATRAWNPEARRGRRIAAALLLVAAGVTRPAAAATPGPEPGAVAHRSRWCAVGVQSGWTRMDGGLADYRWDVTPRGAWGVQALAGWGRFATGIRLWRSATTQTLGLADVPDDPTVRATSLELVGQGRLATVAGVQVLAIASAGRLHLGWDPDRVTTATSGAPITIEFRPVDEWTAAGGVGLRHALTGPWTAGLEIDRRVFALDTAHRSGAGIEFGRESFGNWSARFELAWSLGRP